MRQNRRGLAVREQARQEHGPAHALEGPELVPSSGKGVSFEGKEKSLATW